MKYTYEQLLEKIIRAKIHLENFPWTEHSRSCSTIDDPGSYVPCDCGASTKNDNLQKALDELKL